MSCVNTFAVGPCEESREWNDIFVTAFTLDKAHITEGGYPVDEENFVRNPTKLSTVSSSKTKKKLNWEFGFVKQSSRTPYKAILIDDSIDSDDDIDDEHDVETTTLLGAAIPVSSRDSCERLPAKPPLLHLQQFGQKREGIAIRERERH